MTKGREYAALMAVAVAATIVVIVVMLPGAGMVPWWALLIAAWLACFIATMGLIWREQRWWAEVDAANERPVPNMPGYGMLIQPAKKTNNDFPYPTDPDLMSFTRPNGEEIAVIRVDSCLECKMPVRMWGRKDGEIGCGKCQSCGFVFSRGGK